MIKFTQTQIGPSQTDSSLRKASGIGRGKKNRPEQIVKSDFWKRVDIKGVDECWEWKGGKQSKKKGQDYGTVWIWGEKWKTHRLSWVYSFGPIPRKLLVCHKCDNPPCCNPNHLFLGSHQENTVDCMTKGRGNNEKGENRYNATLTEENVKEIRMRFKKWDSENSGSALAREFKVGNSMISAIVHKRRWKHVV